MGTFGARSRASLHVVVSFFLIFFFSISKKEAKNEKKVAEVTVVKLLFQMPPIDKMDAGMSALSHVTCVALLCCKTSFYPFFV